MVHFLVPTQQFPIKQSLKSQIITYISVSLPHPKPFYLLIQAISLHTKWEKPLPRQINTQPPYKRNVVKTQFYRKCFKQEQALVHLLKIKVHQKSKHQPQPWKKFPELQGGLKPFKWEGAEEMEGGRKGRSLDLWCLGKFTHSWAMLTEIIYFV